MAAPLVTAAAGSAARSPMLRWLAGSVIAAPVLLVVLLILLLTAGTAVQATNGVGAPSVLRAGAVPAAYEPLVRRAAETCPGITAPLLAAQLDAESGWNPRAVSPAGAQGLAQFLPSTWAIEGVDGDGDGTADPFSPADAIASQAGYLCTLLAAVTTDPQLTVNRLELALAAYNAGLGAVQRYSGIPPYPETQQYLRRIRHLLARYADPAGTAFGAGPPGSWVRPVSSVPITSGFGPRWGRLHAGIDFAALVGTPVYAASNGTVLAAGPASGYGQWVKLAHAGGVTTVYGHISGWTVSVGQPVTVGQVIAYTGNEGRSTGPHLHFETWTNNQPVDPVAFYAAHGAEL
jgi:murein DD-endopeptidase MepM/ murein hydrolase activator NlpD